MLHAKMVRIKSWYLTAVLKTVVETLLTWAFKPSQDTKTHTSIVLKHTSWPQTPILAYAKMPDPLYDVTPH